MRRRIAAAVLGVVLVGVPTARATDSSPFSTAPPPVENPVDNVPSGIPAAALAPEPVLPTPAGWPLQGTDVEGFPRTSGTGRYFHGAYEWTDFLYDDHGARGVPRSFPIVGLDPTTGTFEYAAANAHRNGADIFRAGIARDADASYWRVDWNTLADPTVPIAEFAIDDTPDAGANAWPGLPNLASPGIDRAIVISSQGAWMLDAAGATRTPLGPVSVTTNEHAPGSFVVRVPNTTLPTTGAWTVRLVAGQANAAGDGFAAVDQDHGALPNQPPVFNVAFRTQAQEPSANNYWMEAGQANALALGDVGQFKATVDWAKLADRDTDPEPLPTGFSNRWYASSLKLGDGVVADSGYGAGDLRPNYLGQVQPYAVYVPTTYDPATPAPLTWILHSLSEQHNQYGVLAPNFLQQACEQRHSICATTLGRGPDGWYYGEAERDFWEVWGRLAETYRLDPERTVLSGYSMGGWATYKLGFTHPDLFAKAVVLAGPPGCGIRVAEGYGYGNSGVCHDAGDSTPLIPNAKWLPYFIAHGTDDELVPVSSVVEQVNAFKSDGNVFRFELYPGMDHIGWGASDLFRSAADHMGNDTRKTNPGHFTYTWYPQDGAFIDSVYWLHGLKARTSAGQAHITAVSAAIAAGSVSPVLSAGVTDPGYVPVGTVLEQTWSVGPPFTPWPSPMLQLSTSNAAQATVDLVAAGWRPGQGGTLYLQTDGQPTTITLHASTGDTTITSTGGFYSFTA